MKKLYFLPWFLILALCACSKISDKRIIIDNKISTVVDENIIDTINQLETCEHEFYNKSVITYYINDTLYNFSSNNIEHKPYSATWTASNDSIFIYGNNINLDHRTGFTIEIFNNKATVFGYIKTHILMSNLANSPDGPTYTSINIPTKQQKLILSKIPQFEDDIISGYLEFQTNDFYTLELDRNTQDTIRETIRYSKKVYFKASRCNG